MYTVIFSWKLNQSDKNVTIYYKNVYMRCASDYSDPVSLLSMIVYLSTQIGYTLLLTYAKSAIQHFWPTSTHGFHLKLDIQGRSARPQSLS